MPELTQEGAALEFRDLALGSIKPLNFRSGAQDIRLIAAVLDRLTYDEWLELLESQDANSNEHGYKTLLDEYQGELIARGFTVESKTPNLDEVYEDSERTPFNVVDAFFKDILAVQLASVLGGSR